ncbi:MAG: M14 family metallopeptidase [Planctomycetes bacterium]|nr:M14 family metallopeptidase [Planctomycetota bacterium]
MRRGSQGLWFLALQAGAAAVGAQAPAVPSPATTPEASEHAATSTAEQVAAFVAACTRLPHGDRLTTSVAGKSHAGRDLLLVRVASTTTPSTPRRRVLVIGGIHAGEAEGKEALQVLLREFANGEHDDVLARCELWLLPIYNVDGNETTGLGNRPGQNGPDAVGRRENAQGLDLNRDFVKAEAEETRTLLRLFQDLDPDLFVDLHTTDGSFHGYHLTYAPSLSTNVDDGVARVSRALLDRATAELAQQGFAAFDYGNFETHDWEGSGAPASAPGQRGWFTYDHRARYGVNYFGLRNRLGVLSEAYAYADFATRIAVTRAFVLALLHGLVADEATVTKAMAGADAALTAPTTPVRFGFATGFAPAETLPVLVGKADKVGRGDGRPPRFVRQDQSTPEVMPVVRAFRSAQHRELPKAWAVLQPDAVVAELLRRHGVSFTTVTTLSSARGQHFVVKQKKKPKRPFQGHQELVLEGAWSEPADVELPAGTLLVPADQRLARLAATLLEAESEDSLSSWNFFEATTGERYPVLRLVDLPR